MTTRARTMCDECGWVSKAMTPARADFAYRQHSCDRQRQREAAVERRLAAHAAVDRSPQPCRHKIAEHVHGTHACYVLDRCRCLPCAVANSNYETNRTRQNAYGRSNMVDADPVRDHVRALTAAGIGLKRVAEISGVAHGALWKLMYGKTKAKTKRGRITDRTPSRRVRQDTADALLALDPTDPDLAAGGAVVDSNRARRHLEALVAAGWSIQQLSRRADVDRQVLDKMLRWDPVTARHVRAIAAVYAQLHDQVPPEATWHEKTAATRARNRGTANGWPLPRHINALDLERGLMSELDEQDITWVRRGGILVAQRAS